MDIQRQAKIIEKHCGLNYQAALEVAAKCNGKKDWKTYKSNRKSIDIDTGFDPDDKVLAHRMEVVLGETDAKSWAQLNNNNNNNVQSISKLLPKTKELVMSITKKIGMDVPWEETTGPAASNPNYCYRWSFEDDKNKVALFLIWHDHIEEKDGKLIYRYTNDDYSDAHSVWQARAKEVNQALSKALQGTYEVRVAICSRPLQKDKASVVECRELDPVIWDIQKEGSDYILVRK